MCDYCKDSRCGACTERDRKGRCCHIQPRPG